MSMERETWEKQTFISFSKHQVLFKFNWIQAIFEYYVHILQFSCLLPLSGAQLLILAAMIMPVINSCPTPLGGESVDNQETKTKKT